MVAGNSACSTPDAMVIRGTSHPEYCFQYGCSQSEAQAGRYHILLPVAYGFQRSGHLREPPHQFEHSPGGRAGVVIDGFKLQQLNFGH